MVQLASIELDPLNRLANKLLGELYFRRPDVSRDVAFSQFAHGPHRVHSVKDLVQAFSQDEERPEGLTQIFSAKWKGLS